MEEQPSFAVNFANESDLARLSRFHDPALVADWIAQAHAELSGPVESTLRPTCIVARESGDIVAAANGRWLAPRVGGLSGPIVAADGSFAVPELLQFLLSWFKRGDAKLVTSLRPVQDSLHTELQHAGFAAAARISFMVATRLTEAESTGESSLVSAIVPPDVAEQRWLAVLNGTFEDTLDCPALRQWMNAADAITTFQRSSFEEQQWWIATENGNDVGCLILGFDADEEAVEILYLGVVSSARNRRIGRRLLAIAFAQRDDVLVVDLV